MDDAAIFGGVAGLAIGLAFLLRFASLSDVMRRMTPRRLDRNRSRIDLARVARYADRLIIPRLFRSGGPCVPRALILFHFGRRSGLPARIHFGMQRQNGSLVGHAWISVNGVTMFERAGQAVGYSTVLSYPPPNSIEEPNGP